MEDREESKGQLFVKLHRRIAALQASEVKRQRAEEVLQKELQLLRESLNLHEIEQKLVACEIHDGLTQQLTGALMQFEAFSHQRDENPAEAQRTFDGAIQLLRDAMDEARRLIGGLGSPILDESGIVPAVDCLIGEANKRGVPEIEFVHSLQADRLAAPLERAIFRIVQESLTNARRHSRSKRVRVQLARVNGYVCIEVQDWGIGFDPERVQKNRFGLQGIRERARLLGGLTTIDTAPGTGTRIAVELPLPGKVPQ